PPPGSGEVTIRVRAAGLNFIDALDALGMLPFERDWLGVECAGEIRAVGDAVRGFRKGDRVMALARGSFRDRVNVPAELIARVPEGLNHRQAATLPAAYLTAWHALAEVARVQPGEHVLVHAGTGGTGMAAIQVARLLGAEVHATASREKWLALRALGIDAPLDSRSGGFGEALRRRTEGRGIDVIVNSLTGDFIREGLGCLASGGRFLEIGKRELLTPEQVAELGRDISYHPVDLMALAERAPARIDALFSALAPHFDSGALAPLALQSFAVDHAASAIKQMQRARHIGKVVLNFDESGVPVDSDASYLLTGGLGGLGLATAQWLADQGARALVLLGRSVTPEPPAAIETLRGKGVRVELLAGDVADESDLRRAIATANAVAPLRGVVHAAGVLHDGMLGALDREQMEVVLRPKLHGALLLHRLTRALPLDFFVMYSSAASLFGSPGQGAHVAANSALDALAHHRRHLGLPALSVNWGPWSEIGAAADADVSDPLARRGIRTIPPGQGLAALEHLLAVPDAAQTGVVDIDWSRMRRQGALADPLLAPLVTASETVTVDAPERPGEGRGWRAELDAMPVRRRSAALARLLQGELARVLGMPAGELPALNAGFFDLGLDSLMSVDLKARLERGLEVPLAPTELFAHPNIKALAAHLAEQYLGAGSDDLERAEAHGRGIAPEGRGQDGHDTTEAAASGPVGVEADSASDLGVAISEELAALDRLLGAGPPPMKDRG
ncbi:MAG: SDR family NAD(P)-dependent oxidoreductase, partial [Pseudomonadota bacterium]